MSRPNSAVCVALPLAALLAGCGGDEPEVAPDATPTAPSGAQPQAAGAPAVTFEEIAVNSGIDFRMQFLPTEQGEKFKVNLYDHGAGVAVADIDGDGDDDVLFLNQLGPNALYRNDGRGRFDDLTEESGVNLEGRICVAATFGDYDSDGDQDLYITTTRGGNALLRNDGHGTFEDVTSAAGLTLVAHSEQPAFFDYDQDGDLDLYVTNTAGWTFETLDPEGRYRLGREDLYDLVDSPVETNRLYRNDGDGRFTDVTAEAGVEGVGWGGDVAVFDFDGDGDLDLFVSNMFGASLLYRNDGRGKFTECAAQVLGSTSWGAVGTRVFDHDVDGRLDLLVVDMHSDMWVLPQMEPSRVEPGRKYATAVGPSLERGDIAQEDADRLLGKLQVPDGRVVFGTTLYRNLGGGRFDEVSAQAGIETFFPWGAATADYDQNGAEDVFMPTGMGYPYFYWPPALLMNRGDGTFENRAKEAKLDPPPGGHYLEQLVGGHLAARSSRAAATADFDRDGRVDFVVNTFNDRALYYRNTSPARHWVGFRLTGTRSHRDAVGAIVSLRVGSRTQVRQVSTSGGYLSQSSRTLHFGLADETRVESCEIQWPSGARQQFDVTKVDAVHDVTEPAEGDRR